MIFVKEPTCYKNPDNPFCTDLFLTNRPRTFQCIITTETGISDFHKLVVTVLKTLYKKQKSKIIHCRNYKNFENDNFRQDLKSLSFLSLILQMLHYQNLMTLCYLFSTSTLQKEWNTYVQTIVILWLKNWEKQLWKDQN